MDRPDWTEAHTLVLESVEGLDPMPNRALLSDVERDLASWRLVRWDAGCTPGHHLDGGGRQVRTPGLYITPAGLALLAAVEYLDGTAAPSEHCNPRPESTTVDQTD